MVRLGSGARGLLTGVRWSGQPKGRHADLRGTVPKFVVGGLGRVASVGQGAAAPAARVPRSPFSAECYGNRGDVRSAGCRAGGVGSRTRCRGGQPVVLS